jgi:hypothetical protein
MLELEHRKFRGHNKRLLMAAHLTYPSRRDKMVGLVETMRAMADG